MAVLLVLPKPADSLQNDVGFSGKTRTHRAYRKGESCLSATKRVVGKDARVALAKGEKEQSRSSKSSDREMGESQGEREPQLGEREGDQSESMERKGWTPQ